MGVEEETSARMKLAGKLSCRAYLPPGATVSWARVAVRADLERSLKTRLLMHSESLLGAEDEEHEDKVVHEPPRRLFVALPETRSRTTSRSSLHQERFGQRGQAQSKPAVDGSLWSAMPCTQCLPRLLVQGLLT